VFNHNNQRINGNILGLDILPSSNRRAKFAFVILSKNGIKISTGTLEKSELIEYIRKFKIKAIATDNIFEIFSSVEEIADFVRKTHVNIIQVTGKPRNSYKIAYLAKQYGLSRYGKLSPQKTAEIAARLALFGVGSKIELFEDLTEIIISRTRSLGEGGQHQQKYARNLAAFIKNAYREIEDKLKDAGYVFSSVKRVGDFGIKGAKFLVYAPYDDVKKIIKKFHSDIFRIDVRPIERKRMLFIPGEDKISAQKYLICGIDPGDTTGIAILDLNGKVLHLTSKKNLGLASIIETIYSYGTPVLIAADVPKFPQLLERLCKRLQAVSFWPKRIISISEKNEIVRQLEPKPQDTHQRDALIAAILAYKKYKNIFAKVNSILSYIPLPLSPDEIKKQIILGRDIKDAIANSIKSYMEKREESIVRRKTTVNVSRDFDDEKRKILNKLSNAYSKIDELNNKINLLLDELRRKKEIINKLQNQLIYEQEKNRRILKRTIEELKDPLINDLRREISHLRRAISALKRKFTVVETQNRTLLKLLTLDASKVPIKVLEKFSNSQVERLFNTYGIKKGDIIYIKDPSGGGKNIAKKLISFGIRAIIIERDVLSLDAKNLLEGANIAILLKDDFEIPIEDSPVSIINLTDFEQAVKNARRRKMSEEDLLYEELLDAIREARKEKNISKL